MPFQAGRGGGPRAGEGGTPEAARGAAGVGDGSEGARPPVSASGPLWPVSRVPRAKAPPSPIPLRLAFPVFIILAVLFFFFFFTFIFKLNFFSITVNIQFYIRF